MREDSASARRRTRGHGHGKGARTGVAVKRDRDVLSKVVHHEGISTSPKQDPTCFLSLPKLYKSDPPLTSITSHVVSPRSLRKADTRDKEEEALKQALPDSRSYTQGEPTLYSHSSTGSFIPHEWPRASDVTKN